MRSSRTFATIILVLLGCMLLIFSFLWEDHYLWFSIGFIFISILFFLVRFEKRKIEPRELVLLAVLASIAAVGRIPFASIPSVQPTTFVIMMSGLVFGAESGLVIGAVAALSSNMILGQGPWTPWQMLAWGLVGLTAGMLRKTKLLNSTFGKIIFGIIWGFLFGWIMNLWGLLALTQSGTSLTFEAVLMYFAGSSLFDSMHSVSNVFFLLLFGDIWMKNLTRFKVKYGLLD
ncbi:ECF transporter S component [Bacillus sp. OK048]|uniref:ECF transporter S component n=1 Tax=Bacillus sp. OK048 TaxID=1882761 RepID=UPI0008839411|nr:ECF transporter S component [Bacillus sp. OK048]SDM38701.1 energy-coupling factor transport system substrate-specific component [Bacillus sp. OK048]